MMMKPSIQIDHLYFKYPGGENQDEHVLKDISLDVNEGEFVAIIGSNGSGKTTLARHVNGMLLPSQGSVRFNGLVTGDKKNLPEIRKQIGMVFQNPEDQIIASTLMDDVAFGLENFGFPPGEIQHRVEKSLQTMGLWDQRMRPPHLLSAGQMQRLALAGVLALKPRCIIFDEATTMLDPAGRKMVLQIMQNLHEQGLTIIFITHSMDEAALAERILILNQGSLVADGSPRDIFIRSRRLEDFHLGMPAAAGMANHLQRYFPDIAEHIIKMDDLISALSSIKIPSVINQTGLTFHKANFQYKETLIDIEHLGHIYMRGTPYARTALEDVSMKGIDGGVHGLLGMTGSGKSTLLQHINGILRPQSGSVRVGNLQLNDLKLATKMVVQMVGLVFQNPEMQFFEQYVGDEIAYGPRQYPSSVQLSERVRFAMDFVGLEFERFKDRLTYTLSGGEKRKVALASVLAIDPAILLLDEPTAGLDPDSHAEVLRRLKKFSENGKTMVISSHQMDDLVQLAKEATLFGDGRVLLSGEIADLFSKADILNEAGMDLPLAMKVGEVLRKRGLPIPPDVLSVEDLNASLSFALGI
jgi:energy-coupling factor transport system ATP-binding protein